MRRQQAYLLLPKWTKAVDYSRVRARARVDGGFISGLYTPQSADFYIGPPNWQSRRRHSSESSMLGLVSHCHQLFSTGKLSNSDNHQGDIQTRDYEMSTYPGSQNTFSMFLQHLLSSYDLVFYIANRSYLNSKIKNIVETFAWGYYTSYYTSIFYQLYVAGKGHGLTDINCEALSDV